MTPDLPARARTTLRSVDPTQASVAYRVPDLQLDLFVVYGNHAGAKFHTNGEVVHGLEALVRELKEQARFADACITDNDIPAQTLQISKDCTQACGSGSLLDGWMRHLNRYEYDINTVFSNFSR